MIMEQWKSDQQNEKREKKRSRAITRNHAESRGSTRESRGNTRKQSKLINILNKSYNIYWKSTMIVGFQYVHVFSICFHVFVRVIARDWFCFHVFMFCCTLIFNCCSSFVRPRDSAWLRVIPRDSRLIPRDSAWLTFLFFIVFISLVTFFFICPW